MATPPPPSAGPAEMPYAELAEVKLHYSDTAAGAPAYRETGAPTLLLVHGWGGDARAWDRISFPDHRVVAVDLRGHGRSSIPADGYRPNDLARDLVELIGRLETGPVVAIGHSMGAQVVTTLAVSHPEVVRALVVVDPAYGADAAEQRGFGVRLAALRAEGAPAAVRQLGPLSPAVREQLLTTDGHVLAECYAGMYTVPGAYGARPAAEAYLARRRHPVLCLRALAEPARWEEAIPAPAGSRMVVWEGTGHFLHLEWPGAFTCLVTEWLTGLASARGTDPTG